MHLATPQSVSEEATFTDFTMPASTKVQLDEPSTQITNSANPETTNSGDVSAEQNNPTMSSTNGEQEKPKALTGKALKDAKKAEKQARRAAEKGATSGGPQKDSQAAIPARPIISHQASDKNSTPPTEKPSSRAHKRSPSAQHLPIPSRPEVLPVVESKAIPLFEHLHEQTRRLSITGSSKDAHPAVVALGLQMSNYEICGSNARCVAMLLAFKQVSSSGEG
jgi:translation initiation factor eIF-2B subunit delta